MKKYITIDGGTTNTRIYLVFGSNVIASINLSVGAKDNSDGTDNYKNEIKNGIEKILNDNNISSSDIECILASGMITSELGLCNLPHIVAPVGIEELNSGLHRTILPTISDVPFVFIPGVIVKSESYEFTDMMRGEETELFGLDTCYISNSLIIMPGSHSKWILTDKNSKISSIKTMLTGEMIASLSENTILKDAIDLRTDTFDADFLEYGYKYSLLHGLNEALFKIRILKTKFSIDAVKLYSFFMGAILQGEIKSVEKLKVDRIIVGGKRILRECTVFLLKNITDAEIIDAGDNSIFATPIGAVKIYEFNII